MKIKILLDSRHSRQCCHTADWWISFSACDVLC